MNDLLSLAQEGLETGLRVAHIATFPLVGQPADAAVADVLTDPALAGFDFIPITSGERVLGVLARHAVQMDGLVSGAMTLLDSDMLVSSQETLTNFIRLMDFRKFWLVVHDSGITGIVTRSDMLKLPVRLYAFALLAHLELTMAALIRAVYPDTQWRAYMDTGYQRRLRGDETKGRANNIDPDPLELTYFRAKCQIIGHYIQHSPRFSPEQQQAFTADVEHMNDLRNGIDHHRNYAPDEQGLDTFLADIRRVQRWLNELQACLDREPNSFALQGSTTMTQADQIREWTYQNHILPAQTAGKATITIRAGDVHDGMGLTDSMPAVCGALGANKFETKYGIKRTARTGPGNGANAEFTFSI